MTVSQRSVQVGLALGTYAMLLVVFDVGATAFEVGPGVSPWYPSAGTNDEVETGLDLHGLPRTSGDARRRHLGGE